MGITPRAGILNASLVLGHVPDLVRYGSKPRREPARKDELIDALRSHDEVLSYPPHQVVIGNLRPEDLWDRPRPWWGAGALAPADGKSAVGPFGEIMDQGRFYELLAEVDRFDLVRLDDAPDPGAGDLPLFSGDETVGAVRRAHEADEALGAHVLLENLACKASAVHALRVLLESADVDPGSIGYAIGAGEEAVGDRYQRGGGSLSKAVAEDCGLVNATGSDVKAFCTGPIHALTVAGALVESGTFDRVAVVAGGSLAKLGMKFAGALDRGVPVLEDVLAGMAVLVGPAQQAPAVLRLDAVGHHRVGSGFSQQALLEDIVARPLQRMGRTIRDIDRYATELHDPEITEPAGGGDVAERNYRLLGGFAAMRGELGREELEGFSRERGLPGFAPTQGHFASAIPWIPHALARLRDGELRTSMLMAKGSLFLGRMTRMLDGVSITLEV